MVINVHIHKMMMAIISATFMIMISVLLILRFADNDRALDIVPQDTQMYGGFLTWPDVNKIFPKGSRATVIDFDTGITFNVQRRGGSSHADAQPLTAEDTAAMKRIYNEQWSWKRRAAIIQLPDGTKIAASMAGMPHGQGAIPDNDFDGHFCIHFRDSKTHGSRKMDLAHQMMVWKAGGVLDEQIIKMNQEGIINLFFTAINQQEYNIAGRLIHADLDINPLLLQFEQISKVKVEKITALDDHNYNVLVRIVFTDSNHEIREELMVRIIGNQPPWSIAASSMIGLVEPDVITTIMPVDDSWSLEEDWEQ